MSGISRARALLAAAGVVLRADLPVLLARAGLAGLAVSFLLVQFWYLIPWDRLVGLLSRDLSARMGFAALVTAACATAIGALPPVPPSLARAAPRWALGLLRLPTALVVAGPALVAGLLLPGGLRTGLWVATIELVLMGVPAGLLLAPLGEWSPIVANLVALLGLVGLGWRQGARAAEAVPRGTGVPRGAWSALLWRDLVSLWRNERGVVLAAFAAAVPLGVLGWGFRANGRLRGAALIEALTLLVCAVAPGAGGALAALRRVLGAAFDRPAWPVSPSRRVSVLAVVALLWLLPASTALAAGPGLGVAELRAGRCRWRWRARRPGSRRVGPASTTGSSWAVWCSWRAWCSPVTPARRRCSPRSSWRGPHGC